MSSSSLGLNYSKKNHVHLPKMYRKTKNQKLVKKNKIKKSLFLRQKVKILIYEVQLCKTNIKGLFTRNNCLSHVENINIKLRKPFWISIWFYALKFPEIFHFYIVVQYNIYKWSILVESRIAKIWHPVITDMPSFLSKNNILMIHARTHPISINICKSKSIDT